MADIKFYATEQNAANVGGVLITHEEGSGLGFYGNGYGVSVPIGGTQDSTWLTNSDGTASERVRLQNTKAVDFVNKDKVAINGQAPVGLDKLTNGQCPLNIRFEHDEAVRVQNCKLRVFDRNNIANQASGVTTYVYEARHPASDENAGVLDQAGRDALTWYEFDPVDDMSDMPLTSSPGVSGVNTTSDDDYDFTGPQGQQVLSFQGLSHTSLRHDWYVGLSSQPDSIGSKINYALYISVEYL